MSATIFETKLRQLSDRLDVTYYRIKSLTGKQVPTGTPLHELCRPIRTKTPSRESYSEKGISVLKLRNITGRILNITNCDFVPERLKTKFIYGRPLDIVLTATGEGTAGRVDILIDSGQFIITGESILLRPMPAEVNPFYLLAMLRTDLIRLQLTHYVRGATGQTHLYWRDIREIKIPLVDKPTQDSFEEVYREAWKKRRQAAKDLMAAQEIIAQATRIGTLDLDSRALTFETNFSNLKHPLRFDVEYHQPIYGQLIKKLISAGCAPLDTIAKHNRSKVNPGKRPADIIEYVDISSVDIDVGDFETTTLAGHEAPSRARVKPKQWDVLVSTVRPARNAVALVSEPTPNLVASNGFTALFATSTPAHILFACLKTKPIFMQIIRKSTAAMYPAVTEEDIMDILVPILHGNQANEVERLTKSSLVLRRESDTLLDSFKDKADTLL